MENLQKYILSQIEKKEITKEQAVTYLKELKQSERNSNQEIAIIGIACRVPMADDPEQFWSNLSNGRNCFSAKPVEKLQIENVFRNRSYAEYIERIPTTDDFENLENYIAPFIKDFDKFDAGFFNIPPREAKYMDPTQRIFLETAWTSIEDAGYSVDNIRDTNTAVYAGRDGSTSLQYKNVVMPDPSKTSGNWEAILASRINYLFNFKGQAILVDTACSSGLVAVHQACNALRNEECEMAIAGGIGMIIGCADSINDTDQGEDEEATVGSKDNHVRTFDKKGSGTVFGEGCVTFVLKPLKKALKDGDHVYSIIKGSALNCDGASNGITAPNPVAQTDVIVEAWKNAKVNPETISYIETHGTGTKLGDPIEILGISNAFKMYTNKKQFCGVGSVKTNIGHLIGAAGCANMLKIILSMQHHQLPPTIYFETPNEHIDFINSPVYVVDSLREWKDDEKPLRAGVSAFGFSGTNAHLIMEEFQKKEEAEKPVRLNNNIFTISAKTETAMKKFVKRYADYFNTDKEFELEQICYTATTGRGHYNYRLAMVVDSIEQIRENLKILLEEGLKSAEDKGVFYRTHKVVSDRFMNKTADEISEGELSEISESVAKIIEQLAKQDSFEDKGVLTDLAAKYVRGANVKWSQMYEGRKMKRVPIPTYPFDRTHYWGDTKISNVKNLEDNEIKAGHPLVKKCVLESMYESVYLVKFNLKEHWVLQEHKIKGFNLISGTTFIEVCKEALSQYFKTNKLVIEELIFLSPLVVKVEDDDVETHIIIAKDKEKNRVSFKVVSKHFDENEDAVWTEHLEGFASTHDSKVAKIDTLSKYLESATKTEEAVSRGGDASPEADTYFGPRWQCVKSVSDTTLDGDGICTEVYLPDGLIHDLKEGYNFHPGMLDDAIYSALQIFAGGQLFLPFSYRNMKIYRNIPKHFFSILKKDKINNNSEIISGEFVLADIEGNVIAEIEECSLKKVMNLNEYVSNTFHAIKWIETESNTAPVVKKDNTIVIFDGANEISKELYDTLYPDNKVYLVSFGKDGYKKHDDNLFEIVGTEDDYLRLIDDIGGQVNVVYQVSNVDYSFKQFELSDCKEKLNRGLYSLLGFSKALMEKKCVNVEYVLITNDSYKVTGTENSYNPFNASFLALAKSTISEFIGYEYRCIDIDEATDINVVVDEALRSNEKSFTVAYRNGSRYTDVLAAVEVSNKEQKRIDVRDTGCYVITGGTGGLGLEVSKSLSLLNQCHICLIARNPLPERDKWDEIIATNENRKQVNLLTGIRDIEAKGCTVKTYTADVGNYEFMSEALKEIKNEYKEINGVIHCAGVAGDGFMFNKPKEVFDEVISPKIFGSVNLAELTKDEKLDFFIMFSSVQSLLGGPGQGDYTAANAFMDTFAYYLKEQGVNAVTINWPGWKETGMAFDHNLGDVHSVFKSLATQNAITALNDIVVSGITNIVPADLDYEFLGQFGEDDRIYVLKFSEAIERKIRRYQNHEAVQNLPEGRRMISPDELILMGKRDDEYTETEKVVAYIYALVLNITEIDIYENFVAMGGNSILATELLKALNSHFGGNLNITDIFSYACVEELAAYIDNKGSEPEEQPKEETYDDVIVKFEQGDIDIESMIEYFDE